MRFGSWQRDELLAQPRDGMEKACGEFRSYLTGSGSDFNREYAEELLVIRQRKLTK